MDLKDYIRSIPDYPKKGILFRDITTLIKDADAFKETINQIVDRSKNFKIDKKLTRLAKKDFIFLHCLPRGNEVSEDVFLSKNSHVWQQALNRVHVQKSILLYCFGKLR